MPDCLQMLLALGAPGPPRTGTTRTTKMQKQEEQEKQEPLGPRTGCHHEEASEPTDTQKATRFLGRVERDQHRYVAVRRRLLEALHM